MDRYANPRASWLVLPNFDFSDEWDPVQDFRRQEATPQGGEQVCAAGQDGAVVYMGDTEKELDDFMGGLEKGCRGRYPLIVTDLYRARAMRHLKGGYPAGLRMAYATTVGGLAWRDCLSVTFYREYRRAFGPADDTCAQDSDGGAVVAHDLFLTLAAAMFTARSEADFADTEEDTLGARLPKTVERLRGSAAVAGVSGSIAFAGPPTGLREDEGAQLARVRPPLLVLETDGGTPQPKLLCGRVIPPRSSNPTPGAPPRHKRTSMNPGQRTIRCFRPTNAAVSVRAFRASPHE